MAYARRLKLYKDVGRLLFKYGRGDLATQASLAAMLPDEDRGSVEAANDASELADDVERLGPTFVKLGQLLSTRPDIVPPAYAQALTRLQDDCEPFSTAELEKILDEEFGERRALLFASVSPQPIAAASIAQVHHAVLANGREVALKVQRPGIREQVLEDLGALGDVAALLARHSERAQRFGIDVVFAEFRRSLLHELDFRQEAMHLLAIGANLKEIPEILVPQPVLECSTSRVLAMEFVRGVKVTELGPLTRLEQDGERLADALLRAYLKQMLRDGLFHADPHPGNVFIVAGQKSAAPGETPTPGRIALLDLGMVARVVPTLQDRLLQLLLAVSENRADEATRVLLLLAERGRDADEMRLQREVTDILGQHAELAGRQPQVGRAVLLAMKAANDSGFRLPPELALIGKTLLNLDEIGRALAPRFDANAAIRRHAAEITQEHVGRDLSFGSLFAGAVELKNFVQHLPGRVNRILDRLAANEFRVRVHAFDESRLLEGLQKVANRIALGLVLAALIVGAALLMNVPTSFQVFGYPGLAILLFLGAAVGGVTLVLVTLATDIRARRRPRL
jgi:ubiquinone biosynthesis protein